MEEAKTVLGVRGKVEVFESKRLSAPSLFGLFKPRILFPKALMKSLTEAELRLIILHELVHLKRRDVLLNWVIIVAQGLHWFNPVVWLAMRRLRSERELICDGAVMSRLAAEERRTYGETLIKLLDNFTNSSLTPSVVPIINHKNEMQRRISMIANFKPTTRVVTIASAIVVLTVVCLTFTTATEKAPPVLAPVLQSPPAGRGSSADKEAVERRIGKLEKMLNEQKDLIIEKQAQMDRLQRELSISEVDAAGNLPGYQDLQRIESLHVETQGEYQQVNALLNALRGLDRAQLTKAISAVAPDASLDKLLTQRADAEQKFAVLSENFSAEHPEVKSTTKLLERISRQISDRIDGILDGLSARAVASQAKAETFEKAIEKTKSRQLEETVRRRPFFEAKRELESMIQARERLQTRLTDEKIEAALER
jgi:hypothetical protein